MEHSREAQPSSVPVPRSAGFSLAQSEVIAREDGLRLLRRMSNWTAAALIVGVAATTGYLAHTNPVATGTLTITSAVPACTAPGIGSPRPTVSNAVATTGGSGVTVGTSSSVGSVGATGSGGTCGTSGSTGGGGGGTTSPWRDD